MKCIHCYREIDEHLKFCTYCGAKQPLDRAAYEREHPELAEAVSDEENKLRPSLPDAHEELIAQDRKEYINSLLESNTSFEKEVKRLNAQLQSEKKESTKFKRLAIGATAMAVLGFILWFGSIMSSHRENGMPDSLVYKGKEFPGFTYFGNIENGVPNGFGVALYRIGDSYNRKFYAGNFVNGKRDDSNAMVLYNDGDFFYGKVNDNSWDYGVFYSNTDSSHYEGYFKNNEPYTGTWYDHKKNYSISQGQEVKK